MENLVKRVALQTIILRRQGTQFVPAIGDVVELTTAELTQIMEVNPAALGKIEINTSVARAVVEQAVDMDAIRAEALAQARKELAAEAAASVKTSDDKPLTAAQQKAADKKAAEDKAAADKKAAEDKAEADKAQTDADDDI